MGSPRSSSVSGTAACTSPRALGTRCPSRTRSGTAFSSTETSFTASLAAARGLRVIDDACEAIGAEYRGKKLGGFDSKLFPFYFEDLDLSYRAAKRGYKLLWAHDCPVEHRHETYYNNLFTSETLDFMKQTRLLLFIWKNLTDKILFTQHLKALPKRVLTAP